MPAQSVLRPVAATVMLLTGGTLAYPQLFAPPTASAPPRATQPEPLKLQDIFKDERARTAMGLGRLSQEEQQLLADGIARFAEEALRKAARPYALDHDAGRYLRNQGWQEIEVIGVATIKGGRFDRNRELLAVRSLGGKKYYGSVFGDELNSFDKTNLRSGLHWGRDLFRSITLIGLDGRELDLRLVDVDP